MLLFLWGGILLELYHLNIVTLFCRRSWLVSGSGQSGRQYKKLTKRKQKCFKLVSKIFTTAFLSTSTFGVVVYFFFGFGQILLLLVCLKTRLKPLFSLPCSSFFGPSTEKRYLNFDFFGFCFRRCFTATTTFCCYHQPKFIYFFVVTKRCAPIFQISFCV